ncbi:DUF5403 family protein [Streptomyces venezuelae]|uniref:Uncharacterized protein n=1 Tax=Streptomyces venezuelae TaxID=54571 RepID=A0A5P2BLF8_STRVZ|nr:DUF5403 family protein [Streptomyces venezuelae]QES29189.1 hypothetical protein DEJ47_24600 [Streptomyces venezuelae]
MAYMYEKTNRVLARHQDVQDELERVTFEIAVKAEEILAQHHVDWHSRIEVEEGRIDKYVVLSDDAGQKAALSIEYGRKAYTVTREDRDGNEYEVEVPATDGLYVLATASGLPKKRKGKVRVD